MDVTQFRNLVKHVSDRSISSEQAGHFLEVFQSDLDTVINQAQRDFIIKHFGAKGDSKYTGPR